MTSFGFVGIDPTGLVGLADTVDQYAARFGLARRNAAPILDRHRRFGVVAVVARLGLVADELGDHAAGLRWRAAVIERAQLIDCVGPMPFAVGPWLAEFASAAVFKVSDWQSEFDGWRIELALDRLRLLEPGDVAVAFAEMAPSRAESLASQHPAVVGPMDGAPPALRYLANDLLIEQEITRLEALQAKIGESGRLLLSSRLLATRGELQIAELQRWLDEDRQVLLFDPTGDGRVAEVFGDLVRARRIGVLVPGMANDITNFSEAEGGFRTDAARMYESAGSADVAMIAWLGYDTPDGVDVAARRAAEAGAPDLARLLVGIDPEASRSITVVAHSYGSVVAGLAAGVGIEADNLVFVGSPGTTLDSATDAKLRSGGRVWSALAAGDPIGLGVDPLDSVRWWHGLNPVLPLLAMCPTLRSRDELWHGTSPAADDFGARRVTTTGSHGHSEYFEATTLENLVMIVDGRYSEVGLVDS